MIRLLLVALALSACVHAENYELDPYIDIPFKRLKTSAERIREHGYPAESHFVETSDGYVLNVFRIPYSPKLNNGDKQRPVVLLQHGLFSCSDCFLLNGPDNALAYNLVDEGFDVWLGNARGNIYSRNNTKISLNHPYFWAFSWHEIGAIDLPAMIDYILAETGESALHYGGHSQGTTTFFVMGATVPEYNAKIKTAHMLAPVIFMGNATDSLVTGMAPYFGTPGVGQTLLENQVFIPQNPFVQRMLDTFCGGQPFFPNYCRTLFFLWAGTGDSNLNTTLLSSIAETHPAGISSNQGIHYVQLYVSNEFRRYDWGVKKNRKVYEQEVPPSYDLTKISAPMYLYVGPADGSATVQDCQRLTDVLPSLKVLHEVPDPTWGHLDFIFAMKVKETINDRVVVACLNYESENTKI